jgi:catechol 2,3-dioxygenase-like lactoylglutathione lyase family enzyme
MSVIDRKKEGASGHFAPVHLNFDAILGRVTAEGLPYGSAPWNLDDGKLNDWNGGRGVYFKDPDGHILELMTVPQ